MVGIINVNNINTELKNIHQYMNNGEYSQAIVYIDGLNRLTNLDFIELKMKCYIEIGEITKAVNYLEDTLKLLTDYDDKNIVKSYISDIKESYSSLFK